MKANGSLQFHIGFQYFEKSYENFRNFNNLIKFNLGFIKKYFLHKCLNFIRLKCYHMITMNKNSHKNIFDNNSILDGILVRLQYQMIWNITFQTLRTPTYQIYVHISKLHKMYL